jgi:hypothetical protein
MSARKPRRNGKLESRRGGRISQLPSKLRRLLDAIYPELQSLDDRAADTKCRWDFVFHMTDWIADLQQLAKLYEHPGEFSRKEAEDVVMGFLYHATAHIMEAARLLLDYEPGYIFDSPKPVKSMQRKRKSSRAAGLVPAVRRG